MTTITAPATFPFSMFDDIHVGLDENGEHVYVNLAERNMLIGGEPGAGKSSGENLIVAHGALSSDCKLILVDGKLVELGLWRACADRFIGPSITDAIAAFTEFQGIMNSRYDTLLARGRRKITRDDGEDIYLIRSTNTPSSPPSSAARPNGRSSPPSPGTWWHAAARPASSSCWPPSGPLIRSLTKYLAAYATRLRHPVVAA